MANDKIVSKMRVAGKPGGLTATKPYAVYTIANGKIAKVEQYRVGDQVRWRQGQVVVEDPRRYVFADPIQQKHLRTMYRAFGTLLPGVDRFSLQNEQGYIQDQTKRFQDKIRDIERNFTDHDVRNSAYYSDISTLNGETLKTYFMDIMSNRGQQYAKQFLYNLMTPRVSNNEMAIMNYDTKHHAYFKGPRFLGNKNNERMVVNFLKAAMDGKVNGVTRSFAEEIWKDMERYRKISYLMTHDRTLDGAVFSIGNMERQEMKPNLNVIPQSKSRPGLIDVKANNEAARDILQQYITGSYFLDPIEMYRLTVGIDKPTNDMHGFTSVKERVKELWNDTGPGAQRFTKRTDMGEVVYRMNRGSLDRQMKVHIDHIKSKSASERIAEDLKCF